MPLHHILLLNVWFFFMIKKVAFIDRATFKKEKEGCTRKQNGSIQLFAQKSLKDKERVSEWVNDWIKVSGQQRERETYGIRRNERSQVSKGKFYVDDDVTVKSKFCQRVCKLVPLCIPTTEKPRVKEQVPDMFLLLVKWRNVQSFRQMQQLLTCWTQSITAKFSWNYKTNWKHNF